MYFLGNSDHGVVSLSVNRGEREGANPFYCEILPNLWLLLLS